MTVPSPRELGEKARILAAELEAALDDPRRYEWGDSPWEHLGDAERDVRLLIAGIAAQAARAAELEAALAEADDLADSCAVALQANRLNDHYAPAVHARLTAYRTARAVLASPPDGQQDDA